MAAKGKNCNRTTRNCVFEQYFQTQSTQTILNFKPTLATMQRQECSHNELKESWPRGVPPEKHSPLLTTAEPNRAADTECS